MLSAGWATGWHSTVYEPPVQSTVASPPHADTPTISNAVTTTVAVHPRSVDDADRLLMTFCPPLLLPLARTLPEQATACLKSIGELRAGGGSFDRVGVSGYILQKGEFGSPSAMQVPLLGGDTS
ncbi:hypothetical protein SAV14893_091960 [Streptomyces avermitilis]|uniref:Uncharacterized protein n=1 Tax=Streptomyces avermitilis TaxID=33903 RepID=A0A4D4N6N8_STRAX|nr:hypothetical protein SAVMC3_04510 [Streptomyces avermitilis]GDY69803.1 hypothetical protein SAV14893_091960 [Streptomyces avermitilis]GDY80070.1 hypothetical protein SAV31267_095550 [Streptomyces avermitilis]